MTPAFGDAGTLIVFALVVVGLVALTVWLFRVGAKQRPRDR